MSIKGVYKIYVDPESGANIEDTAKLCHNLSVELGIPVEFIHNDVLYSAVLKVVPMRVGIADIRREVSC